MVFGKHSDSVKHEDALIQSWNEHKATHCSVKLVLPLTYKQISCISLIIHSFTVLFIKYKKCIFAEWQRASFAILRFNKNKTVPLLLRVSRLRVCVHACGPVCTLGCSPRPSVNHIYTILPPRNAPQPPLSDSVCLHLSRRGLIYSFEFSVSVCVCNEHTNVHPQSPLIQYSLCLSDCRGPLEECDAHIRVPFWSDCISSSSEGPGLFFAYSFWINEFVLSVGGAQMHTCRRKLVVLRRSRIICHKMSVGLNVGRLLFLLLSALALFICAYFSSLLLLHFHRSLSALCSPPPSPSHHTPPLQCSLRSVKHSRAQTEETNVRKLGGWHNFQRNVFGITVGAKWTAGKAVLMRIYVTLAHPNTGGRESTHGWLWFVWNFDVYMLLYNRGIFKFRLNKLFWGIDLK